MSFLMDYGEDWPPPPQPFPATPPPVDWRRVGQRCINIVAVYCAIFGIGLACLVVRDAITTEHTSSPDSPGYSVTFVDPSPHGRIGP